MRTNPPFADAAIADAESSRIRGKLVAAVQPISPKQTPTLTALRGIHTDPSPRAGGTGKARSDQTFAAPARYARVHERLQQAGGFQTALRT